MGSIYTVCCASTTSIPSPIVPIFIEQKSILQFRILPFPNPQTTKKMPGSRLQDKICIITGGGSGFGKGIVEKFIDEDAKVLIWDIHPTGASDLSSTLPKGTAILFVGDVSKLDD